jgi:transcriptional regulator with XRE-family HTH domain
MDTLQRVYDLIGERNMTLYQLAIISDISPSTLRNTRRRNGELKVETIERICSALGMTLSEFFAVDQPTQ